jgi:hypothetical protein
LGVRQLQRRSEALAGYLVTCGARLYDARILLGPRVLRGCDEWNERERHDY